MHPDAFATLAAFEPEGWYYQARAGYLARLIERFVPTNAAERQILDVGCGTGGTTSTLCRFGRVQGLEPSPVARRILHDRYPQLDVVPGAVGDVGSLFAAQSFDLVTIMGVLYHRDVADPASALREVRQAIKPGGWLIWNEGVYPILARAHDEFVEAGRRFRPGEMRRLLAAQGFTLHFASHLLGWGFPIALALSLVHRARRKVFRPRGFDQHVSDDRPLPRSVNAVLRELTCFEWACALRNLKLPCGVSYVVVAQKSPD